ncbi:MAG TPA: molybdate ABC transporter substrate-binding protein [Ramlibacter sp.]|nr:molybdate ABC transporter substrate-binding protein [Ramlibacter sp.]
MRRRETLKGLAAVGACLAGTVRGAEDDRPALVAVAASVQPALAEIAQAWTRASGQRLQLTFGASGNFVRQIQQGLPAELFLSADEAFAMALVRAGLTRDAGAIYATGRLALLVAPGVDIPLDAQLQGLKAGWSRVHKFAIAHPELAPYGQAAREVLQAVGLWEQARAKLVIGENVAQAAQFVAAGAAQAGLVALSLVAGPAASRLGQHLALPDSLHAPLRQRMVLLKQAGPVAAAFYEHLKSAPAQAVLQRHGFATDQR